jgi:hypothetical protein
MKKAAATGYRAIGKIKVKKRWALQMTHKRSNSRRFSAKGIDKIGWIWHTGANGRGNLSKSGSRDRESHLWHNADKISGNRSSWPEEGVFNLANFYLRTSLPSPFNKMLPFHNIHEAHSGCWSPMAIGTSSSNAGPLLPPLLPPQWK